MFQLILPFQLDLPFEAGGGGLSPRPAAGARKGLERAPRSKRVRREQGRCSLSLELPMGLTIELERDP